MSSKRGIAEDNQKIGETPTFNQRLLECIDEGLDIFGPTVKQIVYWQLKAISNLGRNEIPGRPKEFVEALYRFFGAGGGPVEKSIVREIIKSFDLFVTKCDSYVAAVSEARRMTISEQLAYRDYHGTVQRN